MAVLQVNSLGTSFALKADEDSVYLEKIRDYYDKVCAEIQKNDHITDQKQTAVLAGILIADELFREKKKNSDTGRESQKAGKSSAALAETEAERLTKSMIQKLDGALKRAGDIE